MPILARAFPARSRALVEEFANEVRARSEETHRFYTSLGVRRESWFFQESANGSILIGVTDVAEPLDDAVVQFAGARDDYSSWFKSRVKEISGVDPNETPAGPRTEQIFDSAVCPTGACQVVARAYPAPNRAAIEEFARELEGRPDDLKRFYDDFHVAREAWFYQPCDVQPVVIAVAYVGDPVKQKAEAFRTTDEPFAAWFKQRVLETTGVDPNVTPLGPQSELVYEFRA